MYRSEIWRITGQIFVVDMGVPLFNALVHGEFLNWGLRDLATKKLETLFYGMVQNIFDILNRLSVDHESDRQTDGIAEFAGLEFAGLENDARNRRGGICRTGK